MYSDADKKEKINWISMMDTQNYIYSGVNPLNPEYKAFLNRSTGKNTQKVMEILKNELEAYNQQKLKQQQESEQGLRRSASVVHQPLQQSTTQRSQAQFSDTSRYYESQFYQYMDKILNEDQKPKPVKHQLASCLKLYDTQAKYCQTSSRFSTNIEQDTKSRQSTKYSSVNQLFDDNVREEKIKEIQQQIEWQRARKQQLDKQQEIYTLQFQEEWFNNKGRQLENEFNQSQLREQLAIMDDRYYH